MVSNDRRMYIRDIPGIFTIRLRHVATSQSRILSRNEPRSDKAFFSDGFIVSPSGHKYTYKLIDMHVKSGRGFSGSTLNIVALTRRPPGAPLSGVGRVITWDGGVASTCQLTLRSVPCCCAPCAGVFAGGVFALLLRSFHSSPSFYKRRLYADKSDVVSATSTIESADDRHVFAVSKCAIANLRTMLRFSTRVSFPLRAIVVSSCS